MSLKAGRLVLLIPLLAAWLLSGCAGRPELMGVEPRPASQISGPELSTENTSQAMGYALFLQSQLAFRQGRSGEALAALDQAMEKDPESAYLRSEKVTLLIRLGKLRQATEVAREAVKADSKDTRSRLLLASLLANDGRNEQAEAVYRQVLSLDPDNVEALLMLATQLAGRDKSKEAAQLLERLVKVDPEAVMGHFYLGRVYHQLGRLDRAIKAYKRVLELRPNFEAAALELARLLHLKGESQRAAAIYRDLLQANPKSRTARDELARIYLGLGREDDALKILSGNGQGLKGRLRLGLLYLEDKKYDRAVEIFQDLVNEAPDMGAARLYLGWTFDAQGRPEQALAQLAQVRPTADEFIRARLKMALILQDMKATARATEVMAEAVKLRPGEAELYLAYANVLEMDKKYEAALVQADKGLALEPDNVELLFRKGVILDRLNRKDEGIAVMEAILKLNPKHPHALNYIGYTWADRNQHLDKAVAMIKKALAQRPDSGYIVDSLGWAYYRQGKLEEALKTMKRAVSLVKEDPIITAHLAEVLEASGRLKQALAAWQKSLELKPDNPAEIRRRIKALKEKLSNQ